MPYENKIELLFCKLYLHLLKGLLEDETAQPQRTTSKAQMPQERTEQRPCMRARTRKLPSTRRTKAQSRVNNTITLGSSSFTAITNDNLLWKSGPLTRRDLNIPTGKNTHPTGSMLLKVGDPSQNIDQRHYFRDNVFATANWQPDSNPKHSHIERCFVKFRIVIKGIDYLAPDDKTQRIINSANQYGV